MSEDSKTLWCIEVVGPDDWHAAKSLTHAREMAGKINEQICRRGHDDENEPNVWAVPRIWPWSAEQHAQSLKELDRDEEVEAFALQLYDEFNQHPFDQISVSKAQCIKMARERLKRAKQWSKPVKD